MDLKKQTQKTIDQLKKTKVDKAACSISRSIINELNASHGEISLFRTTYNDRVNISAILDNKKGVTSGNQLNENKINKEIESLLEVTEAGKADKAHDYSDIATKKDFESGTQDGNYDLMYSKLKNFLKYSKEKYPKTIIEEISFDFRTSESHYMNSNDVELSHKNGFYRFGVMFTSKDGEKTSSFNYSGFTSKNLDKELHEYSTIDMLLKQSAEQLDTKPLPENFCGDVIITPDCLGEFIGNITGYLSDSPLITKTSMYKDDLNKKIASPSFTLHSKPLSKELTNNYFYDNFGFEVKNSTIIENGTLKTFLLSLYGANKTGLEKAVNSGGCYVVDPGEKSFDEMVKDIDKGILLARFSGGRPNDNGDFSGVAKNSYYIENGEIKFPLSETMVSGNMKEMLNNIKNISKERINDGSSIFPWIHFDKINVSGK